MKNQSAFPVRFNEGGIVYRRDEMEPSHGLTKRELIAAMAMQGLCSTITIERGRFETQTMIAEAAVQYADALIAELTKSDLKGEG